jgi:hypothetical protein
VRKAGEEFRILKPVVKIDEERRVYKLNKDQRAFRSLRRAWSLRARAHPSDVCIVTAHVHHR